MAEPDKIALEKQLKLFFNNLNKIIVSKIEYEEQDEARKKLYELSKECFIIINAEKFFSSIIDSIDNLPKDEQDALILLKLELEYFNIKYAGVDYPTNLEEAIENGKTVKDSIEKLFSLPNWVKKVLKVLNEILSIVKTIVIG